MALTTADAALVQGGAAKPAAPARQIEVRLVRAIVMGGQRVEPGTTLQLDRVFASTLVSAGKAERVAAAPVVSVPPKPAKPAAKPDNPPKD